MNLLLGAGDPEACCQGMGFVQSPVRVPALSPAAGPPPSPIPTTGGTCFFSISFFCKASFGGTFCFMLTSFFGAVLGSQKVQRFPVYLLSPHVHSLRHCPRPTPQLCICYHEWTYTDTSSSPRVHRVREVHSRWCAFRGFGQTCNDRHPPLRHLTE